MRVGNICNRVDRLIHRADVYVHIYRIYCVALLFNFRIDCVRAAFMRARSRGKSLKRIYIYIYTTSARGATFADKENAGIALTHRQRFINNGAFIAVAASAAFRSIRACLRVSMLACVCVCVVRSHISQRACRVRARLNTYTYLISNQHIKLPILYIYIYIYMYVHWYN